MLAVCHTMHTLPLPTGAGTLAPVAEWLAAQTGRPISSLRVSVGRDPRLSSPLMASSLSAGVAAAGASVARFGACTTPAMFMSCILPGARWAWGCRLAAAVVVPVGCRVRGAP